MLKTLIRYEWKATSRVCLPLYGGLILVALLTRLMFTTISQVEAFHTGYTILTMMMSTLCFGLFVGAAVITLLIQIQRFSKNLLGDEGYLMFTLPARVSQHITAKLLVAGILDVLALIATVIAVMCLALDGNMWNAFFHALSELFPRMNGTIWLFVFEGVVLSLAMVIVTTLHIYASISVGHLARKHRTLLAFGAYFAFYMVGEFLFTLFAALCDFSWMEHLMQQIMNMGETGAHLTLWLAVLATVAVGAVFFAITRYILKHRLNLE